ncbi:MAG: ABC transporter permease [Thermoanaerobaculia bacterium]|nr:ABC transporter permease [Thermoanaerobaculia bacterium]
MNDIGLDLRLAWRALRRSPAFVVTALLTLGLGIGLTTAVFSLVRATLLRPLPFASPERLVSVWESRPADGVTRNVVNPGNFLRWRDEAKSFASLAAMASWSANVAGDGGAERVSIAWGSGEFFATVGGGVQLGRPLQPSDAVEGAGEVVVLSHGLWQRRYGGDPGVVGRSLLLNGEPATIVGVARPSFDYPAGTELWSAYALGERARAARGRYLQVIGRLAPGATLADADAEMQLLAERLVAERPDFNSGWSAHVEPLADTYFGDSRQALWILFAATALVLLVACANLSGLLLARHAERRHQLAICAAIGADRTAIARLLAVETLLLAVAGGALGLAVARATLFALPRLLPLDLPAFVSLEIDGGVLAFAAALTLLAALVAGVGPAWRAARLDPHEALTDSSTRGGSRFAGAARGALVVGQVALSLTLVAAAGLLVRSFDRLRSTDTGLRIEGTAAAAIHLAGAAYRDPSRQAEFFARLEERLAGRPEVAEVGAVSWLPLGGTGSATDYRAEDRPLPELGKEPVADVRIVTPGFFATSGIELVAGRTLDARDAAGATPAVVINRAAARELWGDADPLGRRVVMEWGEPRVAEVVGVVGDARITRLDRTPRAALYWPLAQMPSNFMTVLLRARGDSTALAAALRATVAELDPTIPVARVETLAEVIGRATERPRFTSSLLATFALLATALAAVGLYGLLAGGVAARRRELGVRMALGADGRRLLSEVVGRGLRLVALGVALGIPLAFAVGRLVASQLYEVAPHDPATLAGAPVALLVVGLLAGLLPARRAARTDPASVLRES